MEKEHGYQEEDDIEVLTVEEMYDKLKESEEKKN